MAKLKIVELSLQNFRSFGPYPTIIKLDNLGPVLILGKNEDNPDKSNGCGKTTLSESIIWCLFGRLPGNRPAQISPGDWIVNEKTGKDCRVKLTTADGHIIERTRKVDGHNDLIITDPNGDNISDSTNKNAQQHLIKLFDLDYDIFTSGTFFAQSGNSFLEMPDQKRKKTLERMLNLTKFDQYALVSKEKVESSERQQFKCNSELSISEQNVLNISQQIERNVSLKEGYESQRSERIKSAATKYSQLDQKYEEKSKEIDKQIQILQEESKKIHTYDIDGLRKEWTDHEKELEKLEKIKIFNQKLANEILKLTGERDSLNPQIVNESEYTTKLQEIDQTISTLKDELTNLPKYDLECLKKQWEEHDKRDNEYEKQDDKIEHKKNEEGDLEIELRIISEHVKKLQSKIGTICPECQQEIPHSHVKKVSSPDISKAKEILDKINVLKSEIKQDSVILKKLEEDLEEPEISITEATAINERCQSKESEINSWMKSKSELVKAHQQLLTEADNRRERIKYLTKLIEDKTRILKIKEVQFEKDYLLIESKRPPITINEATLIKQDYDNKLKQINNLQKSIFKLEDEKLNEKKNIDKEIEGIRNDPNPYQTIINDLQLNLKEARNKKQEITIKITNYNKIIKHLDYIHHAYADRKRIRSFVMSKIIPYFNERIAYYLNTFECDFKIEFNSFLQTQSDKWPYELWSGGQKRRIDLAIMLAIHDLHESIYDKQCNILVFDEYDRSLDANGIYAFVNLIFKDFAKPEQTVLVISHSQHMQDMFPTKIQIKMTNGLSYMEEVR